MEFPVNDNLRVDEVEEEPAAEKQELRVFCHLHESSRQERHLIGYNHHNIIMMVITNVKQYGESKG